MRLSNRYTFSCCYVTLIFIYNFSASYQPFNWINTEPGIKSALDFFTPNTKTSIPGGRNLPFVVYYWEKHVRHGVKAAFVYKWITANRQ